MRKVDKWRTKAEHVLKLYYFIGHTWKFFVDQQAWGSDLSTNSQITNITSTSQLQEIDGLCFCFPFITTGFLS